MQNTPKVSWQSAEASQDTRVTAKERMSANITPMITLVAMAQGDTNMPFDANGMGVENHAPLQEYGVYLPRKLRFLVLNLSRESPASAFRHDRMPGSDMERSNSTESHIAHRRRDYGLNCMRSGWSPEHHARTDIFDCNAAIWRTDHAVPSKAGDVPIAVSAHRCQRGV